MKSINAEINDETNQNWNTFELYKTLLRPDE